MAIARDKNNRYVKWAIPGDYPVFHICANKDVICADCANTNEKEKHVVNSHINWEDADLSCGTCHARIPSAYVDNKVD